MGILYDLWFGMSNKILIACFYRLVDTLNLTKFNLIKPEILLIKLKSSNLLVEQVHFIGVNMFIICDSLIPRDTTLDKNIHVKREK